MWLYKLAKFISVLLVLWLSHVASAYTDFFKFNKYFVLGEGLGGGLFFGDKMQLKFGVSKLELKNIMEKASLGQC